MGAFRFPRWLSLGLFGLLYLALSAAAIGLTRFQGGVAFISVANAVLLARLLTLPPRRWPPYLAICAAGNIVATGWVGLGPAAALPMAPMNIVEAAIAALLLHHVAPGRGSAGSRAPLPWFLFAAGVVAPAASAFGGAAVATAFGADTYWSNWGHWYAGHALGAITFTPVAVYLLRGDARTWLVEVAPGALLEAVALTGLVAAVSVAVFAQDALPLLFLPLLPVILATFRIGRLGAAVSVVLVAVVGGFLTVKGHGPISLLDSPPGTKIQFLQFYLACTVVTVLPVGAELARRAALYRRLYDSEARYRLLTEHSTDIVLNLDVDGRIRFASPAIRQIGGYEPAELIGRNATDLVYPADVAEVAAAHVEALTSPSRTVIVEYRAPTATGDMRWFETHTRAVLDQAGRVTGVVSAVRDVGHRKTVEERLAHAAMTDGLTGIANRAAFDARLALAIQAAGAEGFGCVALFDLDHFKQVNDRFGHPAGDAVLRNFADLAKGRMRDLDFVARFGGEEFAVVLPGATLEQARLVCDRLRAVVAETAVIAAGQRIEVTVSGGVARYDGTTTAEQVVAAADAALYDAKRGGRDRLMLAA